MKLNWNVLFHLEHSRLESANQKYAKYEDHFELLYTRLSG